MFHSTSRFEVGPTLVMCRGLVLPNGFIIPGWQLWGSLKFGCINWWGKPPQAKVVLVILLTSERETQITWKEWNNDETTAAWKIPHKPKRQKLNGWLLPSVDYQYSMMTASDLLVGLLTNTKPRIDLVEEEPIPTPKFRRRAAIFEFWFIRHWDVTFSSDASAVEVLVQQNRSVCPWKIGFRKNHLKLCKNKIFGQLEVTFHGPTWKRM